MTTIHRTVTYSTAGPTIHHSDPEVARRVADMIAQSVHTPGLDDSVAVTVRGGDAKATITFSTSTPGEGDAQLLLTDAVAAATKWAMAWAHYRAFGIALGLETIDY